MAMNVFQDVSTLRPQLAKEIVHNSEDMKRFYTLTTEAREDVLGRISEHNSIQELVKANNGHSTIKFRAIYTNEFLEIFLSYAIRLIKCKNF